MDSLARARELLAPSRRVVSFSGAGLSGESGIATFRDPDGVWARYDAMKLASPEGFEQDPQLVAQWYQDRRRALAVAEPNPAHRALANRRDIVHITQNVDDLLERAGAEGVIHLHGTLTVDRCHRSCGHREDIALTDPPPLRDCPVCGDRMRPAVVWFGELLAGSAWAEAEAQAGAAETLLVVGTSGVVYPAAGLIEVARGAGADIVVANTEPATVPAEVEIIGKAGETLPALLA